MKKKTIRYIDSVLANEQTDIICEPETIEATGFIIKETDKYIVLARELVGKEYRGQLAIPKCSIL